MARKDKGLHERAQKAVVEFNELYGIFEQYKAGVERDASLASDQVNIAFAEEIRTSIRITLRELDAWDGQTRTGKKVIRHWTERIEQIEKSSEAIRNDSTYLFLVNEYFPNQNISAEDELGDDDGPMKANMFQTPLGMWFENREIIKDADGNSLSLEWLFEFAKNDRKGFLTQETLSLLRDKGVKLSKLELTELQFELLIDTEVFAPFVEALLAEDERVQSKSFDEITDSERKEVIFENGGETFTVQDLIDTVGLVKSGLFEFSEMMDVIEQFDGKIRKEIIDIMEIELDELLKDDEDMRQDINFLRKQHMGTYQPSSGIDDDEIEDKDELDPDAVRRYVVGDIHGNFEQFIALEEQIKRENPDGNYEIYAVGDLMDRGPQSYEMFSHFKDNSDKLKLVLGNHDLFYRDGLMSHAVLQDQGFATFRNALVSISNGSVFIPQNFPDGDAELSERLDELTESISIDRLTNKAINDNEVHDMFWLLLQEDPELFAEVDALYQEFRPTWEGQENRVQGAFFNHVMNNYEDLYNDLRKYMGEAFPNIMSDYFGDERIEIMKEAYGMDDSVPASAVISKIFYNMLGEFREYFNSASLEVEIDGVYMSHTGAEFSDFAELGEDALINFLQDRGGDQLPKDHPKYRKNSIISGFVQDQLTSTGAMRAYGHCTRSEARADEVVCVIDGRKVSVNLDANGGALTDRTTDKGIRCMEIGTDRILLVNFHKVIIEKDAMNYTLEGTILHDPTDEIENSMGLAARLDHLPESMELARHAAWEEDLGEGLDFHERAYTLEDLIRHVDAVTSNPRDFEYVRKILDDNKVKIDEEIFAAIKKEWGSKVSRNQYKEFRRAVGLPEIATVLETEFEPLELTEENLATEILPGGYTARNFAEDLMALVDGRTDLHFSMPKPDGGEYTPEEIAIFLNDIYDGNNPDVKLTDDVLDLVDRFIQQQRQEETETSVSDDSSYKGTFTNDELNGLIGPHLEALLHNCKGVCDGTINGGKMELRFVSEAFEKVNVIINGKDSMDRDPKTNKPNPFKFTMQQIDSMKEDFVGCAKSIEAFGNGLGNPEAKSKAMEYSEYIKIVAEIEYENWYEKVEKDMKQHEKANPKEAEQNADKPFPWLMNEDVLAILEEKGIPQEKVLDMALDEIYSILENASDGKYTREKLMKQDEKLMNMIGFDEEKFLNTPIGKIVEAQRNMSAANEFSGDHNLILGRLRKGQFETLQKILGFSKVKSKSTDKNAEEKPAPSKDGGRNQIAELLNHGGLAFFKVKAGCDLADAIDNMEPDAIRAIFVELKNLKDTGKIYDWLEETFGVTGQTFEQYLQEQAEKIPGFSREKAIELAMADTGLAEEVLLKMKMGEIDKVIEKNKRKETLGERLNTMTVEEFLQEFETLHPESREHNIQVMCLSTGLVEETLLTVKIDAVKQLIEEKERSGDTTLGEALQIFKAKAMFRGDLDVSTSEHMLRFVEQTGISEFQLRGMKMRDIYKIIDERMEKDDENDKGGADIDPAQFDGSRPARTETPEVDEQHENVIDGEAVELDVSPETDVLLLVDKQLEVQMEASKKESAMGQTDTVTPDESYSIDNLKGANKEAFYAVMSYVERIGLTSEQLANKSGLKEVLNTLLNDSRLEPPKSEFVKALANKYNLAIKVKRDSGNFTVEEVTVLEKGKNIEN